MSWTETYTPHGVEPDEIRMAVEQMFHELGRDTPMRREAIARGIDVEEATAHAKGLQIEQGASGLTPESGEIIVKCVGALAGGLGAQILKDLWCVVILPRLQQRFGADALERRN